MYTIQQLIDKFQTYDNKDMLVMVEGYESGYQPIEDDSFEFNNVKPTLGPSWYDGDYEYCLDGTGTQVLVIGR